MKTSRTTPGPASIFEMRCWRVAVLFTLLLLAVAVTASAAAPRITSAYYLQNQAVHVGVNVSFRVTASGTTPLSYQWRRDGCALPGQTNSSLTLTSIQAANEGDYTVTITNLDGLVTSDPARLWVTPPASDFVKRNFTNADGIRLPYWYLLPTNYNAARSYPLHCMMHGRPGDETVMTNANAVLAGYLNYPEMKVFASYRQQVTEPVIEVWPARRAGDSDIGWSDSYLDQVLDLLEAFVASFNVDTNRIYGGGGSEGVHAVWDLMGRHPGLVAAAGVTAGWPGDTPAEAIKNVPLWAWCAADDGYVGNTRSMIAALRRAGGNPIYTEYTSGGHTGGAFAGACNPVYVDWLLAQRRSLPCTNEPLLSIFVPTYDASQVTGATIVSLAGCADASGRTVSQVVWENQANGRTGIASGTNVWCAKEIPLVANRTNLILVTATTTSWSPALGGNTTFNDALAVFSVPIRATLVMQGQSATLNWTGGAGPFSIQCAPDLTHGNWATIEGNAVPPVTVTLGNGMQFYRVAGR